MKPFAVVSLCVAACAPPYTIIRQATPDPFPAARCKLQVEAIDFRGVNVGKDPESAWLAKKGADEVRSYEADKMTMSANFMSELTSMNAPWVSTQTSPFAIKPKLTMWEPGFYAYAAARPSEASMVVTIVDEKGNVVDELAMSTRVAASITNPSTGGRMHTAGKRLARQLTSYFQERLLCR